MLRKVIIIAQSVKMRTIMTNVHKSYPREMKDVSTKRSMQGLY